ncbi:MAG: sulfatase-like hydrolase/transferase, partial [Chitinophagales bacterium]|nr:sulfatase-like hydrolase/transferase [Chitinophagales bacterium]
MSDISSCSAEVHWTPVAGNQYKVAYKLSSNSKWSSFIPLSSASSFTFNGLLPNNNYDFQVTKKCTDGSTSKKKVSATTLQCMKPDEITITKLSDHTISVEVQSACSYDSLHVRHKTLDGTFIYISFTAAESYLVNGLNLDVVNIFQFSTCPISEKKWTSSYTLEPGVQAAAPPNIILVLIDDSRYDYFSCNGAPSFFKTPNIDRIANEGVNFKRAFVFSSLCVPSRATIATGLSALKTGVNYNNNVLDPDFITVPEVLKDHGYYTALIGKNHHTFLNGSDPEFDYYMVSDDYK